MRRGLAILASTVLLGVVGVSAAGSASADPTGTCPDGQMPIPEQMVPNGEQKDKNDNGFVCAKPINDPHGGPDDDFDPESVVDDIV